MLASSVTDNGEAVPDGGIWVQFSGKSEHQQFTNRWRELIGHDDEKAAIVKTSTATVEQIYNAAKEVYKDYPTILKALGLK